MQFYTKPKEIFGSKYVRSYFTKNK